ncbi:MAG: hypothetical protein K8953_10975 [Proteobacteria bacterium]|nr:hypothetical protein [Pseudomonadota bacterium]
MNNAGFITVKRRAKASVSWLFLWDAGAFVHIELYLRKAHTQKPLVMLGEDVQNSI